ncbi:MAG: helix-turn-helix domain-containing protein [Acidobacteria bacterium]|nr:helix-turn-helix domain-containing protein [Acidobacteriota bacterium]
MSQAKRLTREKVVAIRRRRKQGDGPAILAKAYNVSRNTIYRIVTMKTWKHADDNQAEMWPHP